MFSDGASIAPLINNSNELTVLVDDVKITFLKYPFPIFDPFVIYEQMPLLSVREIAATKAYTIGRRGAYKDYIDLYFILSEQHATLTDIIDVAEKKFGLEFNSRLFLEQIVFLDDVEDCKLSSEVRKIGPTIREKGHRFQVRFPFKFQRIRYRIRVQEGPSWRQIRAPGFGSPAVCVVVNSS